MGKEGERPSGGGPGRALRMALILWAASGLTTLHLEAGEEENLERFLAKVETVVQSSSTDRVCSLLSTREKTIISLPELYSSGGVFGPSQACFILKKALSSHSTVAFRRESRESIAEGESIQLRYRWILQPKGSSDPLNLILFLRARCEDQGWVLSEIRSTRAGSSYGR